MAGISGGVIVRDDGRQIQFRPKCERCGNVGPTIYNIAPPTQGVNVSGWQFHCDRCGFDTTITVYG